MFVHRKLEGKRYIYVDRERGRDRTECASGRMDENIGIGKQSGRGIEMMGCIEKETN